MPPAADVASTRTIASSADVLDGLWRSIDTPVEVSLWEKAYVSASDSSTRGHVPGSNSATTGSSICGAALEAVANFDENSPKTK